MSLSSSLRTSLLAATFIGPLGVAGLPIAPALAADAAVSTQEPQPPTVTVVAARRGDIAETSIVTGTLVPREEVLVNAEIDGLAVVEILVEEGDRVEKGQVMARLSRDTVDVAVAQANAQVSRAGAAIAQAEAQISQAQATLDQAVSALDRTERLQRTGTASVETLETRQMSADVARAQLEAARESLAAAEADKQLAEAQKREQLVRLGRTEIKAPTAGIVSRRTARVGAVVASAGDPLFRIIEAGDVELEANVAETTLARLAVGQPATIVRAGRDQPFAGTVRLIPTEIDPETRLGRVRIAAASGEGMTIGAFAYATVETARANGILVPLSAILYGGKQAEVQVVVDAVVETRPVKVGLVSGDEAEVIEGISEGDEVVRVSGTFLRGGDRVNPVVQR